MKRLLPIFLVIAILAGASYYLLIDSTKKEISTKKTIKIEDCTRAKSCATLPKFLYKAGIKYPVIDLSQEHYMGIVFYDARDTKRVLHKKSWERFEYLGTYAIDRKGNIYLTPNPFISIKPTTFNLQKGIYKIDSISQKLTRWMVIDEVEPTANNPYGLISIVYDCNNNTLWASAIDKSNYKGSKGRIYHIDPNKKEIIGKIENFDALTVNLLYTKNSKYLIAGSAIDNGLYFFKFNGNQVDKKPFKVLDLPDPNLRIRKIRVIGKNRLILEAIKFSYSLIAQSDNKKRYIYEASYNNIKSSWHIILKK